MSDFDDRNSIGAQPRWRIWLYVAEVWAQDGWRWLRGKLR